MGAIQKHCGSETKTLRERESAPSVCKANANLGHSETFCRGF